MVDTLLELFAECYDEQLASNFTDVQNCQQLSLIQGIFLTFFSIINEK